jgi:hypothetical protein
MATYETNSIGFPLKFSGPDSVEAYDQKGGKQGLCLEDAIDNTIYRSTLPEWQDKFAPIVEQLTGVKRSVNEEATAAARARSKTPDKVKDVLETVPRYVKRAMANLSDEDKAALATEAQKVADGIEVDPSPSKRQGGLRKDLREKAESLLTLPVDQLESKITGYLEEIPGYDLERDSDNENKPQVESLARLVGEIMAKRLREV